MARLRTAELLMHDKAGKEKFIPLLAYETCIAGLPLDDFKGFISKDSNFEHWPENEQIIEEIYAGQESTELIKMSKPSNYELIEHFLRRRFDFRFNMVKIRAEVKPKGAKYFKPIGSYELYSLHRALKLNHIPVHQSIIPAIITSDFIPLYDPFEEYFLGLPKWDGKTDHIEKLANTVKTDDDELWKSLFKKWIVALVASAINEKIINHTLIVFSGAQGIGKTRWMERLVPDSLKDYYFSGVIDPKSKDSLTNLSECFLINLDDFGTLNRAELSELKQIITTSIIRIRRPYERFHDTFPRRASFMCSVNTQQFLNDTTGSRRFLVFEIGSIDYQHKINIDEVYAQALALYKSGFISYLEADDIKEVTKHNEKFQLKTYEEELLLENFQPIDKSAAIDFMTSTNIFQFLSEKYGKLTINNISVYTIGKLMSKYGFERKKHKDLYMYAVKNIFRGVDILEVVNEARTFLNNTLVGIPEHENKDLIDKGLLKQAVLVEKSFFDLFIIDGTKETEHIDYEDLCNTLEKELGIKWNINADAILHGILKAHGVKEVNIKEGEGTALIAKRYVLKRSDYTIKTHVYHG